MTTEVKFCLCTGFNTFIDEDELDTHFSTYCSFLLANWELNGTITINSSGQPEGRVDEDLSPMIQNLCFLSIPDLLAGNNVIVPYWSCSGEVRLAPSEQEVVLSGDYIALMRVPRQELVEELYHCGHRFVRFLSRLADKYPDFRAEYEHMDKQEQIAKHALTKCLRTEG